MNLLKSLMLAALLLPAIFISEAQTSSQTRVNIKTNPFAAMVYMIPIGVEVFVSPKLSIGANTFLISSETGVDASYFDQQGFGVSPELRYYFLETETKGQKNKVYFGGMYQYEETANTTLDRYEDPIPGWSHAIGGSLVFGNQWFFKNRFTLDVFMGPAYMKYVKNANYDTNLAKGGFFLSMTGAKASGTRVKFGFSIGIAF